MSTTLRKAICFGPSGTILPSASNAQSLHFQNAPGSYANLIWLGDTGTRWIRIFVDLYKMWPSEGIVDLNMRDQLDMQIAIAKLYGHGVILAINYRLPRWITGAAAPDPTDANAVEHYPQVMPANTDLDGPWAFAFRSLATRYSLATSGRPWGGWSYVDIIEFVNEPNQLMRDSNYQLDGDVAGKTAVLFKRAKQIVGDLYGTPLVAGPATSDLDYSFLPNRRNYYHFTEDVLQRLNGNGFYSVGIDTSCVWTQHNYTDICYDQGTGTNAPSAGTHMAGDDRFDRYHLRSATTRSLLQANGWKGWPSASTSDPKLFLTEGAPSRAVISKEFGERSALNRPLNETEFLATHSLLLARNLLRLSDDVPANGKGVEMLTNYLMVTVPDEAYDGGLVNLSLTARPAYGDVWKPYPSRL